jgi:hypothetical protein
LDAELHCYGPPLFVAGLVSGEGGKLIGDILARFTFPTDNKDVDLAADAHVSWDGELFYLVTGNVVMRSFKYHDTSFTSGDTGFMLDSNGLMVFPVMDLHQENGWANVSMMYVNTPGMTYKVCSPAFSSQIGREDKFMTDFRGVMPGKDILNCIFPKWRSAMLDLSGLADMNAHGVIDFHEMEKTDFRADIAKSSCKWNSIPITNLSYKIAAKNLDMEIKDVKGRVYNGDLRLNYSTNFETMRGRVSLTLDNADFPPLAKKIKWTLSEGKGTISLTTDANLSYDDGDALLMFGKGHADVKNANLWEVPVIRYFGRAASKWTGGDWGVISELSADFAFEGDHLTTENIQTNGNVIALRGRGKYYWRSGDYDFLIHAEVFKSALPYKLLSKMFDPLTGLLERRVVRRNGKTSLKKVKRKE